VGKRAVAVLGFRKEIAIRGRRNRKEESTSPGSATAKKSARDGLLAQKKIGASFARLEETGPGGEEV